MKVVQKGFFVNAFKRPVPDPAYNTFRNSFLREHTWVHYLFHSSYCWFKDNINKNKHKFYKPKEWLECHDLLFQDYES